DEDSGDEAENLRTFPEGSDGEGLELAGDSIDDEFLRDLWQEHAEAEPSQDEGDRESAPTGQGPGREPNPRQAPDRSGDRPPQGVAVTTEAKTLVAEVAVGMFLTGAYGIMASHRNLKHSVDLIAEVDCARTETLVRESTRFMQPPPK